MVIQKQVAALLYDNCNLYIYNETAQYHYIVCIINWQIKPHKRIPSLLRSVKSTEIQ